MIFTKSDTRSRNFRQGSVLISVLVTLLVVSILGIGLITITGSGLRNAVYENKYNAVYYIAESGINRAFKLIEIKASQLSRLQIGHEEFFSRLSEYVADEVDGLIINDFETVNSVIPSADIGAEYVGISGEDTTINYSEMIGSYSVTSSGNIEGNTRRVSSVIDVYHRIFSSGGVSRPAFDYILYQGGTRTLTLPSGSDLSGSVYGYSVVTQSSRSTISGDVISVTNVDLANQTTVKGDVFAYGLNGTDGDVILRSSGGNVKGDIHAKGDVTISSGCIVEGSVYCGVDVSLLNSGSYIYGNAYAGSRVYKKNNTSIQGDSYAGGNVNQHMPANINQPYPPLVAPDLSMQIPLPAPALTEFESGTLDVTLDYNWKNPNPQTIVPGSYRDLNADNRNTIRLSSGNYYFDDINANQSSIKLQLDFSDGPINVYVKDDVTFGSSFSVEISDNGISYTNIRTLYDSDPDRAIELSGMFYTEIHGDLTIGSSSSSWFGTALVGNNIRAGNSFVLIGGFAVLNGTARFDSNPVMIYAPPSDSAAGAGTGGTSGGGEQGQQAQVNISFSEPIRES